MANELTEYDKSLLSVVEQYEIVDLIKPLVREIHLFDSYIAGTTHLEDESVLEKVKPGDALILQREVNKFDEKAILILNEDKCKLGYIPEKDNTIFSHLMDAGKILKARVRSVEKQGSFHRIGIGIYLVDL